MIITSLTLTLFSAIGGMSQYAYASQIENINDQAHALVLNAINDSIDAGFLLTEDEQTQILQRRFLRFVEDNAVLSHDIISTLTNGVNCNSDLDEFVYGDSFPTLDISEFGLEEDEIEIEEPDFNFDLHAVVADLTDGVDEHSPFLDYHGPWNEGNDDEGDGDDEGGILIPDHSHLTDTVDSGFCGNIWTNGDLWDPHTAPEEGGNGGSSGSNSSETEYNIDTSALRQLFCDDMDVSFSIGGRVEGTTFIGLIFSPGLCAILHDIMVFIAEAIDGIIKSLPDGVKMIGDLIGLVDLFISAVNLIAGSSLPGLSSMIIAEIISKLTPVWATVSTTASFSAVPIGKVIVAAVLVAVGYAIIKVMAGAFVAAEMGAGYAIGWKYYHIFHWEWFDNVFFY